MSWGLEARHAFNGVVLNRTVDDAGAELWPHYKLDKIGGLQGLADFPDDRIFATARQGEIPLSAYRRGRTITYEGRTRATSLAEMRQAQDALAAAFAPTIEDQMVITPHPLYDEGSRFYFARCIALDEPDDQAAPRGDAGYWRPFAIAMRASDPRIYSGAFDTEITGPTSASGGTTFPVTLPVEIEAPGYDRATAQCENTGTADTDAIIDIYGRVRDPWITNVTTGKRLRFAGVTIQVNDFLRVDFKTRDVLLNGVVPFRNKLNTIASDWWDAGVPCLVPGMNSIRLSGQIMDANAQAVVTFYPAYSG